MYRKILVGGATAAVILGAGTAAVATTGSTTTTTGTPATSTSTPAPDPGANGQHAKGNHASGHHGKARLLKRAAHAQITVKGKDGYVTHDLIKGTVTSVSATSITVQAGDKTSETFSVGKDTKVVTRTATKGAKPSASTISKVAKGDHVVVAGTGTGTAAAKHVVDLGK